MAGAWRAHDMEGVPCKGLGGRRGRDVGSKWGPSSSTGAGTVLRHLAVVPQVSWDLAAEPLIRCLSWYRIAP